jgi:CRP-like cAMP-binding protein
MTGVARAGEIVGEMACMNFYPRTASAQALEDCQVLEVSRAALDHLPVGPFRDAMERAYRDHVIPNHLRRSTLLAPLRNQPDRVASLIADLVLAEGVELARYGPDQLIFAQDEEPHEGLFTVNIGHVKVSSQRPGGEAIVDYVGPLDHFGEVALLPRLLDIQTAELPATRQVTCRAIDHVELLRIRPDALFLLPAPVRHALVASGFRRLGRI